MPITELLSRNARLYSDETSLIEREPAIGSRREISWKEFEEQANRFANALIKYGIERGDKVIILLMNCLEWLPIYFGILKTGAMAVPLNFRLQPKKLQNVLKLRKQRCLFTGPSLLKGFIKSGITFLL